MSSTNTVDLARPPLTRHCATTTLSSLLTTGWDNARIQTAILEPLAMGARYRTSWEPVTSANSKRSPKDPFTPLTRTVSEQCPDYDLCETCHDKGIHPADHQFQLVDLPQGNAYPLLTFSGFIDLQTLDILGSQSPNVFFRPKLNSMLQHFNLLPERGPIPEAGGILPDYPNANTLERIRKAREAHAEEQKKIENLLAQHQMELMKSQLDSSRFMMWSTLGWRP